MQVKLLFTFCLCAFLSYVAKAESWLYWCVAESGCYQEVDFNVLRIGVADKATGEAVTDASGKYVYLEIGNPFEGEAHSDFYFYIPASSEPSKSIEPQWSILGSYAASQYSYYVEMLAWDDATEGFVSLGTTPAVSFDTMNEGKHWFDSEDRSTGGVYAASPYEYANIPEPSSAILLLTGVAALVLKRRKA